MKGGTIVDATIITVPSSTKNCGESPGSGNAPDEKGNEWKS